MDIGFKSVIVCYDPCVPHGLSLVVIMCIYALEHSLLTSQFLKVNYTQGLYHFVSKPNTMSRVRVTEGANYKLDKNNNE